MVDIVQRTYFAAVDMRHLLFFIDYYFNILKTYQQINVYNLLTVIR